MNILQRRLRATIAGVVCLACSPLGFTQSAPTPSGGVQPAPLTAIVGGSVANLDGGIPLRNAVILVEGERIKSVGPAASVPIPPGARIVHADGKWLIPGLMNMHVHLDLILPGASGAALANETSAAQALRMASNARLSLDSGVTTVRLVGTKDGADFALKDAVNQGLVPGPRIVSAGEILGTTGGHGIRPGQGLDGPYEFERGVREQIRRGASWIKLAISGGIADAQGAIGASQLTREELKAAIEAAHQRGVKVTAHASSAVAVNDAVDAGIDCIEHGFLLTEPVLRKMKEKGVYLVPTIVVTQSGAMDFFRRIGSPEWYLTRVKSVGKAHWTALQTAIRLGVPIVLGTDQYPFEPNEGTTATVREAELYVDAGMTSLKALRAATVESAKLLGIDSDVGLLTAGRYADIVGVDADPTQDIRALRKIGLVMKAGRIVRDDWGS